MNGRLLIDFGSTFTKAVYVDLDHCEIVSEARHYSTVDTDVTEGLGKCLSRISDDIGVERIDPDDITACSSAAGGLRMVCIGFVPDYSSEAANLAALGAGAKVVGCYSYEITQREMEEVESLRPDIILLTGGTDGGNKKVICHNAEMLGKQGLPSVAVIVAGNKAAEDDIRRSLAGYGDRVFFSKNVMPEIGKLDTTECNARIREIFIDRIVEAKGIGKAKRLVGDVLMPTPLAVLQATRLLAEGTRGALNGVGETLVVDVGGATTDIHSLVRTRSAAGVTARIGLPEPDEKRTVEADLGLKYNLEKLVQLFLEENPDAAADHVLERFSAHGFVPSTPDDIEWHTRLSHLAVEAAVRRHVGRIESKYGPSGEVLLQYGKDFSEVTTVIGTGGPIVFSSQPEAVLQGARFTPDSPLVLKPKNPKFYLDSRYILFAAGLLGQTHPHVALEVMQKYLKKL